jgi:acetoin utilization deacetylase AcuC-like enzyme
MTIFMNDIMTLIKQNYLMVPRGFWLVKKGHLIRQWFSLGMSVFPSFNEGTSLNAFLDSAGFDASPHEYSSMSRHNRHVPTSFFNRFAKDVSAFADDYAAGKVVSVLEGGYSDRGLVSGVGAWVEGLGGLSNGWWDDIGELTKVSSDR